MVPVNDVLPTCRRLGDGEQVRPHLRHRGKRRWDDAIQSTVSAESELPWQAVAQDRAKWLACVTHTTQAQANPLIAQSNRGMQVTSESVVPNRTLFSTIPRTRIFSPAQRAGLERHRRHATLGHEAPISCVVLQRDRRGHMGTDGEVGTDRNTGGHRWRQMEAQMERQMKTKLDTDGDRWGQMETDGERSGDQSRHVEAY